MAAYPAGIVEVPDGGQVTVDTTVPFVLATLADTDPVTGGRTFALQVGAQVGGVDELRSLIKSLLGLVRELSDATGPETPTVAQEPPAQLE